ncbi:MAG: hypothetical protein E6Z07_03735 [Finegoldia magna]|nr:hypothetical protein [Finegoldia magna]
MFTINDDYNKEELKMGSPIKKSGVYTMKCTRAKIYKSANTSAESLGLTFEDKDGQKAWFSIWYKNKDGEDVEFATRHINHLLSLCDINKNNMNWDKEGNIVSLKDKFVGVIVEVNKGTDYKDNSKEVYEYSLQGFYDYKTNQTVKEKRDNTPAVIVNKYVERYQNAPEVILNNNGGSKNNNANDLGMNATLNNYNELPF